MEEIRQYYKFRPDEIFRRITVTSLVTLMLEVSKLEYQQEDAEKLANQIREDQVSLQKAAEAAPQPDPELEVIGWPYLAIFSLFGLQKVAKKSLLSCNKNVFVVW